MILSCNSCEKKFIVPDSAISNAGRLVQCSSCGNKWKQFPIKKNTTFTETNKLTKISQVPKNTTKIKKRKNKARVAPNLYTPEYLAKKHGIKISEKKITDKKGLKNTTNTNFGFYNSLIVFSILLILFLRILYFSQNLVVLKFPFLETYLNYLFESIKNIKEIIFNFFFSY